MLCCLNWSEIHVQPGLALPSASSWRNGLTGVYQHRGLMIAHKYTLASLALHAEGFVAHGSQLKNELFNKPFPSSPMASYHTQTLLVLFCSVLFYSILLHFISLIFHSDSLIFHLWFNNYSLHRTKIFPRYLLSTDASQYLEWQLVLPRCFRNIY